MHSLRMQYEICLALFKVISWFSQFTESSFDLITKHNSFLNIFSLTSFQREGKYLLGARLQIQLPPNSVVAGKRLRDYESSV